MGRLVHVAAAATVVLCMTASAAKADPKKCFEKCVDPKSSTFCLQLLDRCTQAKASRREYVAVVTAACHFTGRNWGTDENGTRRYNICNQWCEKSCSR